MKKVFLLGVLFLSLYSCKQESYSMELIQPKALAELIEKDKIQLADVRTQREYDNGAIEGSVLVDFYSKDFLQQMIEKFDKKKPIYVYCAKGGRSNKAAQLLIQNGFRNVYDLDGGYDAWSQNQKK